jgi:hypothetical protein
MTASGFKNKHRLHLSISKQNSSANVFNNGMNAELVLSSHKGINSYERGR